MANMYDISGLSYHPSTNMDWFTKAIFGGKLIERGKITPIIGVKNSTLLNKMELTDHLLQADNSQCGWTPEQAVKLSEKELKIKTYKINLEQCIDELESKRIAWMLSPGAKNTELPDTLEEATLALLATELYSEIEKKIFTADSAKSSDDFDGAVKVLTASADAIKLKGIAITKDNVLAEIEKVFVSIPIEVIAKGVEENSLNIYVSYATLLKAKMALSGVYGNNVVVSPNFTLDGDIIRYMGVELVPVKGLTDSEMIGADSKNFILGTDLVSDLEEMRLGQFAAPMDSKIFIDGRLRLGFVIPFEDEVVFYSPDVETSVPAGRSLSAPQATQMATGEVGFDGVSPVVDGIDQTPKHKLPLVGDLTAKIKASESIEDIEAILETEAHTLRDSPTVKQEGEARIKELKGGE